MLTITGMLLLQCEPGAGGGGVDGSDMDVSARVRLKDYLVDSRYPVFSRPADEETPASAADWPGVSSKSAKGLKMTGYAGDALRAGSLEVQLQLSVAEAGRYSFFAVARDGASGRPVATSTLTADYAPGEHTATLVFYGLSMRDGVAAVYADYDAPAELVFEIDGVGAERVPNDRDLEQLATGERSDLPEGRLPYLKATHTTAPYDLARFSERVWDSPEKRRRIAELEAEVAQEDRDKSTATE